MGYAEASISKSLTLVQFQVSWHNSLYYHQGERMTPGVFLESDQGGD